MEEWLQIARRSESEQIGSELRRWMRWEAGDQGGCARKYVRWPRGSFHFVVMMDGPDERSHEIQHGLMSWVHSHYTCQCAGGRTTSSSCWVMNDYFLAGWNTKIYSSIFFKKNADSGVPVHVKYARANFMSFHLCSLFLEIFCTLRSVRMFRNLEPLHECP